MYIGAFKLTVVYFNLIPMLQRFLILFLFSLCSLQMAGQPAEQGMPADERASDMMLKRLNSSIQQQQIEVNNLSSRLQDVQQQNDSLENEVEKYQNALNDSLSNYKNAIKEEIKGHESDVNSEFYELRKRFFIVAGFVLVLALLILVVYLILYRKYKNGYTALEERYKQLEEKYEQLNKQVNENDEKISENSQKILEKDQKIRDNDKKLRENDQKLRKDVDHKIEKNNESLAEDIRLIHGPALKMAREIQDLRNKIKPDMERQEARQIEKEALGMERELRKQGYHLKDYTNKNIKKGMLLNIQNMEESEAVGKRVNKTLTPEIKFGRNIIKKAVVEVEDSE